MSATDRTPFMLAYASKVIHPPELAIHTHRLIFQGKLNNESLKQALDLLPIMRDNAYLREETIRIKVTGFSNHKVKKRL